MWDAGVSSRFNIFICAHQIRSLKDLGACVTEKILTFVAVAFSNIYSCLSVSSGFTFLNIFISVYLMNC